MEKTPKDPKDRPDTKAGTQGESPGAPKGDTPSKPSESAPKADVKADAPTRRQGARRSKAKATTAPAQAPASKAPSPDKVTPDGETPKSPPQDTQKAASSAKTAAKPETATVTKPDPKIAPAAGGSNAAIYVALFALLVALGAGAFAAWQWQQDQGVRQDNAVLASQLADLEQDLAAQRAQLAERIEKGEASVVSQQEALTDLAQQQTTLSQQQQAAVQEARAMLEQAQERQPSDWILAEADYLVRMAERKLWLEQDPTTALALLQDADGRLASLEDNELGPVREALARDMTTLKALPRQDLAGIALGVEALIGQIDKLPLNQTEIPEPVAAPESNEVSTDLADWRQNLARSWRAITETFITVRHRQAAIQPMMAPDQEWYLREHLKGKLMQAQLALYHGHQDAFAQALNTAHTWIRDYFDLETSSVQAILGELDELAAADMADAVTVELESADGLSKLVRARLGRNGGR